MRLTRLRRPLSAKLKQPLRTALLKLQIATGIEMPSVLAIGSFGEFEVAYRRGTADEMVLAESFEHDTLFSGIPEYQPRQTDVVIDIGAHIGTFTLMASRKVPRGLVYAIEACNDTYNLLRVNVALNRAANVIPLHMAVSDTNGTCELYYDVGAGNWGHSVVSRFSDQCESVECCTLQQLFSQYRIDSCSFVKFNCEGAEFPIILTSPPELLRRIAMMLVLYHCDLWKANSERDLISHLQASGFACIVRNRSRQRGSIVAVNSSCARQKWMDAIGTHEHCPPETDEGTPGDQQS